MCLVNMLFLIPILLLSTSVNSMNSFYPAQKSAASDAQIRFAVENKYDQTGPGAKGKELAYNTHKTLEDALIGYLDDPDTKLPAHERAKATHKLYSLQKPNHERERDRVYLQVPYHDTDVLYPDPSHDIKLVHANPYHGSHLGYLKPVELEKVKVDPFRFKKIQMVKGSPVNLAHFTRDPYEGNGDFNPNPQYSFSYGVHDRVTGDSKTAQETRNGGLVHGFYSFIDPDGKQRTVQYTANDAQGFRAIVKRTPTEAPKPL